MSTNLKEKSLVTKVFASASCDANQPLITRDFKNNTDILSKITADEDMQDLLAYICTRDKLCIVVIDFAELTKSSEDFKQFSRNNPNIVNLIVHKLPYNNSIRTYMFVILMSF